MGLGWPVRGGSVGVVGVDPVEWRGCGGWRVWEKVGMSGRIWMGISLQKLLQVGLGWQSLRLGPLLGGGVAEGRDPVGKKVVLPVPGLH